MYITINRGENCTMRILKDFKIPNFKFPKFRFKELSEIDEMNIDYEQIKKAK